MVSCQTVSKLDSKGRISIPSEIRKTLGLNASDILEFGISISGKFVVLKKNDCDSVTGNTAGCGPAIPSSNPFAGRSSVSSKAETLGRGPRNKIRRISYV